MKSKEDLRAEIATLAAKHTLELPDGLEGMKYPALAELLEKLQAQVGETPTPDAAAPAGTTPPGDQTPPADAVTPPAASTEPPAPAPRKSRGPGKTHKRPTLEEFVKAGYKAENYEEHMREWEAELAAAQSPPDAAAPAKSYVVAPGKSLTCARGLLGPGKPVRESDFTGESTVEDFAAAGYLVEAPASAEE